MAHIKHVGKVGAAEAMGALKREPELGGSSSGHVCPCCRRPTWDQILFLGHQQDTEQPQTKLPFFSDTMNEEDVGE